jgi:hypothetical protein
LTPGGRFLVVASQSATLQDGGSSAQTRRYARLLYYDIVDPERPKLVREHVVPLPVFQAANGQQRVAARARLTMAPCRSLPTASWRMASQRRR